MIYRLAIHHLRIKSKPNLVCVLNNSMFHCKMNTEQHYYIFLQIGLCVRETTWGFIRRNKYCSWIRSSIFVKMCSHYTRTIHKYFMMFLNRTFTWYLRIMQKFSYVFIVVGFGDCQRISGEKGNVPRLDLKRQFAVWLKENFNDSC